MVSPTAIANILKEQGLELSPKRRKRTSWRTFLKAHWDAFAAVDFFTVEAWTLRGPVTFYVVFVMELSNRKVQIAGITPNPNDAFMIQVARNLTHDFGGSLQGKRFLIIDRDNKYYPGFIKIIEDSGIRPVRTPVKVPNCNAYAEKFVRSIKYECLSCMIFLDVRSHERTIMNYIEHYHGERNHQGIGNRLIYPMTKIARGSGKIRCRERLGGLLQYNFRKAA